MPTLDNLKQNSDKYKLPDLKLVADKYKLNTSQEKPLPLASDTSSSFIKNLFTSAKDIGTGVDKSLLGLARGTAQMFQGAGQRIIAGFTGGVDKPGNLANIQKNMGFKSLDDSTPEGKSISDILQPKNVGEKTGNVIGDVATAASAFAGDVGGAEGFKKDIESIQKPFKTTADFFSNLFKGKAQSEILATPESELHKLSPADRKVYFDSKQEAISNESKALEEKVKKNLQESTVKTQAEAEKLKRDLAVASRDEVVKLRPKIIKAMGEQSQVYRNLIDEELAPHANVKVSQTDLKTFIDSQFTDDPGKAQAIRERLGIKDIYQEPTTKGGKPTLDLGKDKTLGEIYNQTKSLKQDISSGARAGSKVFTSDDKLTDDAIHTLTDFMKKQGVDFSEANKFWAKYAPIRNQLVAEAKPFLQTETQTSRMANTITRVAQGKDVNNENFIKEVENLLQQTVGEDTKKVLSKLSANEKMEFANKIDSEMQQAEIQLRKEKTMKVLSDKEFEVARAAKRRAVIKKTLIGAGITIGGAGAEVLFPKETQAVTKAIFKKVTGQ